MGAGLSAPLLHRWLPPESRILERHTRRVNATSEVAYDALLNLPLTELPLVRALFWLRGIRYSKRQMVRDFFVTPPFFLLEESSGAEAVFAVGTSIRAPYPDTPEALASVQRGLIAVANMRAVPTKSGTRIETETWAATYGRMRVLFRIYWLFVGPFSAFIRRQILSAAKRKAEAASR